MTPSESNEDYIKNPYNICHQHGYHEYIDSLIQQLCTRHLHSLAERSNLLLIIAVKQNLLQLIEYVFAGGRATARDIPSFQCYNSGIATCGTTGHTPTR